MLSYGRIFNILKNKENTMEKVRIGIVGIGNMGSWHTKFAWESEFCTLAAVCDTKTPQGIAAVVRMQDSPALGQRLVVMDGVQDPGNVGTIIRTADAAGFDGSSQLDGTPFYDRQPVGERFALVIGSEGNGVTDEVKAIATHRVKLPMRGGAESLNAAVAAGIMMYELTRHLD